MTRYTPLWLQAGQYAASVDRRLVGALWPVSASTGCAVSVATGMTVNIAAGTVAVPAANGTGTVLCASDAAEQVTLAAAPGAGTNRWDLVACQARGNDLDGGANNDFLFTNVTGTAAATPTVPATPANAVALAQIYVAGGSAAVTAGNITDVRPGLLSPGQSGRGQVGAASTTTSVGGIVNTVQTVLSAAAPLKAGRRYRVTGSWRSVTSTVAADVFLAALATGAAGGSLDFAEMYLKIFDTTHPQAANTIVGSFTPATDNTYTLYLLASRIAGTGTGQIQAGATCPIVLFIDDMGAP